VEGFFKELCRIALSDCERLRDLEKLDLETKDHKGIETHA
jgi:hypothetical protein